MRQLFVIDDTLANKISYFHLMLLMASMPFDIFYSHLILVSLLLHTLIHLRKKDIKPLLQPKVLLLQSVFFVSLVSTAYTINFNGAFNELGRLVTILLIPILFCLNPLDLKKYRQPLLLSFALVCTLTIIYLYAEAFGVIRHYKLPVKTLFSGYFTNHNFAGPIDMHATFFSLQVAVALIYLLAVLIKEQVVYKKLLYLVCCAILTAGLIQLSSKSIFAALIIIINFALPWFLFGGRKRVKAFLVSGLLTALAVIVIVSSGTFRERYITELKSDLSVTSPGATDDSRLARWEVVTQLIGKSPLIGYGAGSEMGLLQDSFFKHKLYNSYLFKLNSHDAYLSFLIKSGIWGLLVYLGTLFFGFRVSLHRKDLLLFTVMTLVTVVSISENLLDVDKGSFFYALFFSFFIFSGDDAKPETTEPEVENLKCDEQIAVEA